MTLQSSELIILEELNKPDAPASDRLKVFFRFLLDRLTQGNRLHLYSLFAKIAYLDGIIEFSDYERRALHACRKFIETGQKEQSNKSSAAFFFSIKRLLSLTPELKHTNTLWEEALADWINYDIQTQRIVEETPFIRAAILAVEKDNFVCHVLDEIEGRRLQAKFNVSEINEQFNISIQHLDSRIELPVMAHFFDNRFLDEQTFIPSGIVLDPDYLIDVTSIAECFTPVTELPLIYLMRQLMPKSASPHLLLGNIANTILDRFMLGDAVSYDELMTDVFQQFAINFTLLSDGEVKDLATQSKNLIGHLYKDVSILKNENKGSIAYIEPAFISSKYGVQGRLDALFLDENYKSGKIVELKSGKPYRENEYGLSRNHYIQTLLYDMMIKSAFGSSFQSINYILYCKLKKDRLKQAPTIKSMQFDALKVRNDLLAIHHHLMNNKSDDSLVFRFNHPVFSQTGGFLFRDAQFLFEVTKGMSDFEKRHYSHYCSLIASENYMSKVGGELTRNSMGFSALWQSDALAKEENFNILRKLQISEKLDDGLYRYKMSSEGALSNFRRGDIVVLYPHSRESNPIGGQLLKGSLIQVTPESVDIRLRNPLIQSAVFESIEYWNAEHDFIESSTRNTYRSLFSFYQVHPDRRSIYLGLMPSKSSFIKLPDDFHPALTEIQRKALWEMISAEEYYLLWGPPGTGKTSVMLSSFVDHILNKTKESIMLVAYTNRAVDEICHVLNEKYAQDFIRIGSSFSVPESMQSSLLQNRIKKFKKRQEIRSLIQETRIFVGTLASISGKEELFSVKKFDRMVVDEASQILEPQLLGLISKVKKTVLIGDHKQLPAVVVSTPDKTKITSRELNNAGYWDTSISMFERLYRRCIKQGWTHSIGRLNRQGRMHKDISKFVSNHFYENQLELVEHIPLISNRLNGSLHAVYKQLAVWSERTLSKRVEFIDIKDIEAPSLELRKMSEIEAQTVNDLCTAILKTLSESRTIGVICPFRAQIALIKSKMESRWGRVPENITIDTVERYQGGARDIIVLSTCAVNKRTFDAIRSIDLDGADRKLNVALSRAREQIIFIGDRNVLSTDDCYRELIRYAEGL